MRAIKTIYGTATANVITASPYVVDFVFGGAGNDRIIDAGDRFHGASDDFYFGGAGNDTIKTRSGFDHLFGEKGNDDFIMDSNKGAYIDGGSGFDEVWINIDGEGLPRGREFVPDKHETIHLRGGDVELHNIEVVHFVSRGDF